MARLRVGTGHLLVDGPEHAQLPEADVERRAREFDLARLAGGALDDDDIDRAGEGRRVYVLVVLDGLCDPARHLARRNAETSGRLFRRRRVSSSATASPQPGACNSGRAPAVVVRAGAGLQESVARSGLRTGTGRALGSLAASAQPLSRGSGSAPPPRPSLGQLDSTRTSVPPPGCTLVGNLFVCDTVLR